VSRPPLTEQDILLLPEPILVHCPSPFFVQHTVQVLDWLEHAGIKSTVVCSDTDSTQVFLDSLGYKHCNILFLEPPPSYRFSNPISLARFWLAIRKSSSRVKEMLGRGTFLFFGLMGQPVMSSLLSYASHYARVIYAGVREHDLRRYRPRTWKQTLRLHYLQVATSCPHILASRGTTATYAEMLIHDESKIKLEERLLSIDPLTIQKHSYRPTLVVDKKPLLFLERNDQDVYVDYNITMAALLTLIKSKGYYIYLKPHPRVGFSRFLADHVDEIIPAYVPAEFISCRSFALIVTNYSTGIKLAYDHNIPGIVFERMFKRVRCADRAYILNMLSNPSHYSGKVPDIEFPSSMEELETILLNRQ
jgi:hypothetical protein